MNTQNRVRAQASAAILVGFQVRCRLRLAPFSMACGPWRLKSVPSASKKSLFNDLRVASNDPPGFRKRTDFILSTDDRRPYCLPRRGNRGLMQHRKEPPLIASLYRRGPSVGYPRPGMAVNFEDVHDAFPDCFVLECFLDRH